MRLARHATAELFEAVVGRNPAVLLDKRLLGRRYRSVGLATELGRCGFEPDVALFPWG